MKRILSIILLLPLFVVAQMPPQAQQFIIFTNVTQGYTVPGKGVQATSHLVTELLGNCKAGGTTYLPEWANIVAAYPFISNTANANRTNLVNLANTDAAYRIVFAGSPTMDLVEGISWNGSTQYGDIKVNPSLLSSVNMGMGVYSRTSMSSATKVAMGVTQDVGAQSYLVMKDASGLFRYPMNTGTVPTVTSSTTTGWWYASRISTSSTNAYHNATNLGNTTFVNSQPNTTMYLGAAYYPTVPGAAFFAAFHNVFAIVTINVNTDADEASIYNAIQDYQTIMGRQL